MAKIPPRAALWIAVLAAVALAALFLMRRPEPAPAPAPEATAPSAPRSQPAPVEASPAPRAPVAPPGSGQLAAGAHDTGAGAPSDVNQSIPPADGPTDDPSVNPPIEPEKPQTPEWKLEKTARIAQLIDQRLVRLEKRIQEAQAKGDTALAEETRILMERSKKRRGELQQDMEALREQIRSSGGTPPSVAGGEKP